MKSCECEHPKHHPKGSVTHYSKFQVKKLLEHWIQTCASLIQCNFTEVEEVSTGLYQLKIYAIVWSILNANAFLQTFKSSALLSQEN